MKKKLITVLLIVMGLLSSAEANAQWLLLGKKAGEGLFKPSKAARKTLRKDFGLSGFKYNPNLERVEPTHAEGILWSTAGLSAWNQFMLQTKKLMVSDTGNSVVFLGTPARQVVEFPPQSVNLLSHPNINFTHDRLEFDPNFHNLRPQSSPNEPTSATQKEKKKQHSYDATFTTTLHDKDSEAKSRTVRLLSPEDDKRWGELGNDIEELGFRLGLEKKMKLLFNKGMKFDFKKKNDLIGFNNYNYGYEYELYAA